MIVVTLDELLILLSHEPNTLEPSRNIPEPNTLECEPKPLDTPPLDTSALDTSPLDTSALDTPPLDTSALDTSTLSLDTSKFVALLLRDIIDRSGPKFDELPSSSDSIESKFDELVLLPKLDTLVSSAKSKFDELPV